MKVVLFCGGFGMRLREYSESIPKPMVKIGYRPIVWHLMKYYAHFGFTDFILCLGWKADYIKEYFLNYDECLSNDFVLSSGGNEINLLNQDIHDWNITFVDTGTSSNLGQRLLAVKQHLQGEEAFLANYTDGLSDLHLPDLIDFHFSKNVIATFLSVRAKYVSCHTVDVNGEGLVQKIEPIGKSNILVNGGFFIFSPKIFDYMEDGDELVEEPFERLISHNQLSTFKYEGFWACMDTFKEKELLDGMYAKGNAPWEVWKQPFNENRSGNVAQKLLRTNGMGRQKYSESSK